MAEDTQQTAAGAAPEINCPRCGLAVTAAPVREGDRGLLFECPGCGTEYGIVPDIPHSSEEVPQAS